jgi:16S rRNA (cytosine967-C5)-methyltransferase
MAKDRLPPVQNHDAPRSTLPQRHEPVTPVARNSPALADLLLSTADAVQAVRSGRSLDEALARCAAPLRAGTQALSFEVLRRLGSAQAVRALLVQKPPAEAMDALLLTVIALLLPTVGRAYDDHTLVNQAVEAARRRQAGTTGFVNAVLRRFIRERDLLMSQVGQRVEAASEHLRWWVDRVRSDWPADWQQRLAAANRHAPMWLRANARRCSGAELVERLAQDGVAATAWGAQAVLLESPLAVTQLPGFAQGELSVQDLSAQRAVPLLLGLDRPGAPPLRAGARVLDACAAPGGKTAQLLELADIDLLALDHDGERLLRVADNLARLGLGAELKQGDAAQPGAWWDGRPFDAILLDAPCTASGIVRRHPDVRWLRRPTDIASLARIQAAMLDALWPLLAPGGRLVYATCSIFRAEGQTQIDAFLQRAVGHDARPDAASPGAIGLLPDNSGPDRAVPSDPGDGFFVALLHKA